MKKNLLLTGALLLTFNFLFSTAFGQSPNGMSYQAVIRNSSDALVTNTQVGMQISILQGSASGTVVYTETQTPTTNANGLVSIEIGDEAGFSTIDWANGPYFIKTETDPNGGTNYTINGASQLLSVPYALHAKTVEIETDPIFGASVAGGITLSDTTNWNNKQAKLTAGTNISIVGNTINASISASNNFYIGQDTLGGIVFYINIGSDGQQHGLIVSKTETTAQWQITASLTNANRSWDGVYNMNLMTNSPARNWITGNFSTDWYLPSIDELGILWHNRFHVNKALNNAGETLLSSNTAYWSSTEYNATNAFTIYFHYGRANYGSNKMSTYSVRAVRAF